jgi:predicted transcriptional regulator
MAEAVRIMRERGFKQLPVVNGNHNLGSVSERGISRRILDTKKPEHLLRKPVSAVMDEALPTVSEELPTEGIIPLLLHTQAVLTTRRRMTSGIMTNADLLKLIQRPGVYLLSPQHLRRLITRCRRGQHNSASQGKHIVWPPFEPTAKDSS